MGIREALAILREAKAQVAGLSKGKPDKKPDQPGLPLKPSGFKGKPSGGPPAPKQQQMEFPPFTAQPYGSKHKDVQHPGSHGGKGYYTKNNKWRYGTKAQPFAGLQPKFPNHPGDLDYDRPLRDTLDADLVKHPDTGQRYVAHRFDNVAHAHEVMAAHNAYRAAGINVPDAQLYTDQDGAYLLQRAVRGARPLGTLKGKDYHAGVHEARQGFVMDALLGNWNVSGDDRTLDGLLVDDAGKVWRFNHHSALRYRSMGKEKGAAYGDAPDDIWSMRDHSKAAGGDLFAHLPTAAIHYQLSQIARNLPKILNALPADVRDTFQKRFQRAADHFGVNYGQGNPKTPDLHAPRVEFTAAAHPGMTLNGIKLEEAENPEYWAEWKDVPEPETSDYDLVPDRRDPTKMVSPRMANGVVFVEPDGRFWFYRPSLGFGGVTHTLSRGGQEKGLTRQQNALKEAMEELGLQGEITGTLGDFQSTYNFARFYIGKRTAGAPWDHTWEVDGVTLATPEEAEKFLSSPMDQEVLKALKQYLKDGTTKPITKKTQSRSDQPGSPDSSGGAAPGSPDDVDQALSEIDKMLAKLKGKYGKHKE